MQEPPFTGVGVALVTLFRPDGALDAPATAEHAARMVDLGMRAIVIAGTTGEAFTLDAAERLELLRAVRPAVPPQIPVVAGTGAPSSAQAVRLTREACDAGADGVLVLGPSGVVDVVGYYESVVVAAGEVPVLAYHFPRVSPPGVPVEVLASLSSAGVPIAGVKDSGGDAVRLLHEVDVLAGVAVYTGSSALLGLAGAIGAAGAILGIANAEPELSCRAFAGDAAAQRDVARAERATKAGGPAIPGGLKAAVAARFGTSVVTRTG